MGSPVTQYTALGRRAKPIRKRLRAIIAVMEQNPPPGVRPGHRGGHNYVSSVGYIAKQLFDYAERNYTEWVVVSDKVGKDAALPEPFVWKSVDSAQGFVRSIVKGGSGHHRKLDLLEPVLASLERAYPSALPQPPMPDPAPEPQPTPPEAEKRAQRAAEASPLDREIAAMPVVYEALKPLAQRARQRVVDWALDMYAQEEANG